MVTIRRVMAGMIGIAVAFLFSSHAAVPMAAAAPLSDSISCTLKTSIIGENAAGDGYYYIVVGHFVRCNQPVAQIKIYATDYKEGFEDSSKISVTETCNDTDYCHTLVHVPGKNCPRGWIRTRSSADIGTPSSPRAYQSIPSQQQRLFWDYFVCY